MPMIQQARAATKMKYAWDVSAEKDFSDGQLKAIDQISEIISGGGNISELKKKIKFVAMI